MELLCHRYGWTPDQVRAMRIEDIEDFLTIIQAENHIKRKHGR